MVWIIGDKKTTFDLEYKSIYMKLRRCLFSTLVFLLNIPMALQAQEKYQINFGISTPGTAVAATDMASDNLYYYGRETSAGSLEKERYNSFIYPTFSFEFLYIPAESGLFNRLNFLGHISLHSVDFEDIRIVRGEGKRETAFKTDLLAGVRYNFLERDRLKLYSQFMVGFDIWDESRYWKIIYDHFSDGQRVTAQITYLGLDFKLGKKESKLGALLELGYGSEYAITVLPFTPGIRAGLSYRF